MWIPEQEPTAEARRRFLRQAVLLGLVPLVGHPPRLRAAADVYQLPFANGQRDLVRYPGKRPMLRLTTRPPQLETPFSVFAEGALTPNDAFFVRYHLSGIPTDIDPDTFTLSIDGHVDRPLKLSLAELRSFQPRRELVAVHQCSGNSRGFFVPRINGGQLGHGAMGNARWTGIPLRTLLERAGPRSGAVAVTFNGLDRPILPATPDLVKALPLAHALDGDVIVAFAMNGEDLPMLNGYPLRLVVPGYFGTYWVKHLHEIRVVNQEFDGFFMGTAYRVPDNDCACLPPGATAEQSRPIGRFRVRSFITHPLPGTVVAAGAPLAVRGFAFDGGAGIARVELSSDGGGSWASAELEAEVGPYAFRGFRGSVHPPGKGRLNLLVRATSRSGETQPVTALWNPGGYAYNAIFSCPVEVA